VSRRAFLLSGLLVALVVAGVLSFWASGHPDGLEFVAERTGFLGTATEHTWADSPFADYRTRGIDSSFLSGGLAGVIGCLVVLALAGGLAWAVRRRGHAGSDSED